MRREVGRSAIKAGFVLLVAGGVGWAGCRSSSPSSSDSVTTEGAVTSSFVLPMVVGLSPADVVLGASGVVTVGDNAHVDSPGNNRNGIVALGSTGTTTIGLGTGTGAIWSKPNVVLNGSAVFFYKTAGTAQVQAGTGFGSAAENRDHTPIRQDPFWTYSISTPTTGTSRTVANGQTLTLAPGNYGPVTVLPGGILFLMPPPPPANTDYGFVSLDIRPGAFAQQGGPMTVSVNSTLKLGAAFGSSGMTLKYAGATSVTVAAPFTGDLFLAPNAAVAINANSTGRFFAKNITVAQNVVVSATTTPGTLTTSVRTLLPTATVAAKGIVGNGQMAEIASAVLTPATTPTCTEPTAFVSYHGASLVFQKFSQLGSGNPANLVSQSFSYPTPPNGCFGPNCAFPAEGNQEWPWPVLPGGAPEYSDVGVFTDNTMIRIDGGRAMSVGFSLRYCDDPNPGVAQGPNCPPTEPLNGAACNSAMVTGRCIYGTTPSDGCTCSGNTFQCTRLRRLEEGTIGLRMTSDCGATWTAGQFDPAAVGNQQAGRDRPESYFDPFDKKVYVSMNLGGAAHCGSDQNIVYVASTAGVTNANQFTFQRALPDKPADNSPEVLTTVLDERAQLPSGVGRWVHFATARCPLGGSARVVFVPPSGTPQEIELSSPSDPTTECHNDPIALGGLHYGPSIVGISSSPPRFYVAYVGTSQFNKQLINVWAITLMSANGYAGPHIVQKVATLFDASHHYFFPQLIRADGQAGSDLLVDTPVILRYTTWDGADTIEERAIALYSGLTGDPKLLSSWSINTACGNPSGCFAGDYRYGSFVSKTSGKLLFFAPWSGQGKGTPPPGGVFTQGATIEVAP